MSQITWRNVDAPDFTGALTGVEIANKLFNRALESGQSMVGQVQGMQTDAANRAIMARQLAIQDPEAYQRAVADGSIVGPDAAHASMDMLRNVDSRIGTLAEQAQRAEQAKQTAWQNQRTRTGTAAEDAWAPFDAGYRQAIAQNDGSPAARAKIAEYEARPEFKAMYLKSQQNVAEGATNQGRATFELNNTQTKQAEDQTVESAVAQLKKRFVTPELQAQEAKKLGLPDRVLQRVMTGLGMSGFDANLMGGTGAPVGGNFTTGSVGNSPFISSIPFGETKDYVSKITSSAGAITGTNEQKADQLLPHLISKESAGNPNAVSNKGAYGLTQLMPDTARAMEKKLGMAPGLTDRDPEANKKAGRQYLLDMLNKYDGNVEYALAAYNAGPGNMDAWLSSKQVNPQTADYVSLGIGTAAGQQAAASPLASRYAALLENSTMDPFQAIKQAQDAGYIPKELDAEQFAALKDTLVKYQSIGTAEGAIRPANVTLAMLMDSSKAERAWNFFPDRLGGDLMVDTKKFDATAELERTGGLLKNSISLNQVNTSKQAVDQAKQQFQEAQARLNAVLDLQARMGGHEEDVAFAQAAVDRMQAKMAAVVTAEGSKPQNQPIGATTTPEPIATTSGSGRGQSAAGVSKELAKQPKGQLYYETTFKSTGGRSREAVKTLVPPKLLTGGRGGTPSEAAKMQYALDKALYDEEVKKQK